MLAIPKLDRLFKPRQIAVLGGGWGRNVIFQLQRFGFQGEIWPIHPEKPEMAGVKTFPSLKALPAAPDACFLGVNRQASIPLVKELAAMGGGGVTSFASGFAETGDQMLQPAIIEAAGSMPLIGPNCYGFINALDGVALWPDQHGCQRVEKGVAIFSQSSNIAINLSMQRRGLPIGFLGCLGNQAQIAFEDMVAYWLEDERITAIGGYCEGLLNPRRLAELSWRAHQLGKAIIILKAGQSEAGQAATHSHTASMAGSSIITSAYFRQAGIIEADGLNELLELLKLAHYVSPQNWQGKRLCSLSCSGGEAGLMGDLMTQYGLPIEEISPPAKQALAKALGPLVTIANPLDYQTYIWGDVPKMAEVFTLMFQDYDAGFLVFDMPHPNRCDRTSYETVVDALKLVKLAVKTPLFVVSSLTDNLDEELTNLWLGLGVIPLGDLTSAVKTVAKWVQRPLGQAWLPLAPLRWPQEPTLLKYDEDRAKAIVAGFGVTIPKSVRVKDIAKIGPSDLAALSPPYAVKALGYAHKTEANAVRLNLTSLNAITELAREFAPAPAYLIEEMVQAAQVELLVTMRRDQLYGLILTIGQGGVLTELYQDSLTLVWPFSPQVLQDSLASLRIGPLFKGYRGKPPLNFNVLWEAIAKLGEAMIQDANLIEMEFNPLMMTREQAVAADVLLTRRIDDDQSPITA